MRQRRNIGSVTLEVLKQRLENHRGYIARQWHYYAAFILLNGLLINAVKDLAPINALLLIALGLAFVTTSAVFFHLINWTQMRIHRNAIRINELTDQNLIEIPNPYEGVTPWLLFSILVFTVCWLIWLFLNGLVASLLGILLFTFIVGNSLWSTRKWLRKV